MLNRIISAILVGAVVYTICKLFEKKHTALATWLVLLSFAAITTFVL